MRTVEQRSAPSRKPSSHSHTIINLMGSSVTLTWGRASSEAFMPYYEFELVTNATCQHQGGMIWSGGPSRTSRGRAHACATRTDVPQFCNPGSRSCNPETPPRSEQIFVLTITYVRAARRRRSGRSSTPKLQPKLTEAGSIRLQANRPHLSSLDPQRTTPSRYVRRWSIRTCASRIWACRERCAPMPSGVCIPDTSAVR